MTDIITTTSDFVDWSLDNEHHIGDGASEALHLLTHALSHDEWTLCFLHLMFGGQSGFIDAQPLANGARLTSTKKFGKAFDVSLSLTVSHKACKTFADTSLFCNVSLGRVASKRQGSEPQAAIAS